MEMHKSNKKLYYYYKCEYVSILYNNFLLVLEADQHRSQILNDIPETPETNNEGR